MQQYIKMLVMLLVIGEPAFGQKSLDGKWQGAIVLPVAELKINVAFLDAATGLTAKIDIPQQGAQGLALQNIRFEHPNIYFELPAGPGLASFDGRLQENKISGEFTQGSATGTFHLERARAAASEVLPYKTNEVVINAGAHKLAGTLAWPHDAKNPPAVVLVSGSGPQNRDEEIFGFKPFRLLTDALTASGIAVLRYDDRGVGASGGEFATATTEDFAADAMAAVRFLRNHENPAFSEVGMLGHSEGGLIAMQLAAKGKELDWIILLAGPGLRGDSLLILQSQTLMARAGQSQELISANESVLRQSFSALRQGDAADWQSVTEAVREVVELSLEGLPEAQRQAIPDHEAYAASATERELAKIRTPWFRYFIDLDPLPLLANLEQPVLAVFGDLDLQVPAEQNIQAMLSACDASGKSNFEHKTFVDANHLFQSAQSGLPGEYARLPKEFVPGMTDILSEWIKQRIASR